jgi:ribosomal protein L7Ae-like RNA K-turn-binding protein
VRIHHTVHPPTGMQRPTKRQRIECPPSWMDCETISAVPYLNSIIRTPVASQVTKEIFLERLEKEIVKRFRFSLSSAQHKLHEDDETSKKRRNLLRKRIQIGTNACTQALQKQQQQPRLVVVAGSNAPPAIVLAHIPVLTRQQKVPLLLLPATAQEVGKVLGTKRVVILTFLGRQDDEDATTSDDDEQVHDAVDSFVDFMRLKVPTK